jgi:16S rRNA A1518/A1519 N6-dimethyltransferase RsmA/KsgA/DIM1 with predicted DNA glycosylase/AP lyase activity
LAALLDWRPTSTVADIGAGHGQLTLAVAKHVGKIYSTEVHDKLPSATQFLAARRRPKNRSGHGMPQKLLVEEFTSVGFEAVKTRRRLAQPRSSHEPPLLRRVS